MERYKNINGNSPITHYQIFKNAIGVWFNKGKKNPYIYPTSKTGNYNLQQLILRAKSGKGLSAYINQNVRNDFIQ